MIATCRLTPYPLVLVPNLVVIESTSPKQGNQKAEYAMSLQVVMYVGRLGQAPAIWAKASAVPAEATAMDLQPPPN